MNATNDCVAGCDQGNGTAADTAAYSNCVQTCIGQNYFTSTGTPAESTGASGSTGTAATAATTATGSAASSAGSSTKTGTATSSSATSSSTSNAAHALSVGFTGMSLFGVLAGFLAL